MVKPTVIEQLDNLIRDEFGEEFLTEVKERANQLKEETRGMSIKERDEYLTNKMSKSLIKCLSR